jgi:hypothetical protein
VNNIFLPAYNVGRNMLFLEETMKPSLFYSILIGSFIAVIMSSCGGSAPAPVVNPPAVETSLASTARALAKQTEAANPYTATPSPAPTETFTPTPKISMNGTSLVRQEDESTLFTDHKLGYQITIPAGWLPVRINEDEYYRAFTNDVIAGNPDLVNTLTKLPTFNPDNIRLFVLDIHGEAPVKGMVSAISVIHQPETDVTLDEWANLQSNNVNRQGYQLLSKGFQETASGTRILVRDESFDSLTDSKILKRRVFFSVPSGVITLDLEIPLDNKDTLLPEFEQIVNSLTFLES